MFTTTLQQKSIPKVSEAMGKQHTPEEPVQTLSFLVFFFFFLTGDTQMNNILETWGCPHGRPNQRSIVMLLKGDLFHEVVVSYGHKGLGENNHHWFQRQPGSCDRGKAIQEVVPNKTLGRHGMFNNSSTVGQKSIVFGGRGVAMRGIIEELFFCFKSLYRSIHIYIPLQG